MALNFSAGVAVAALVFLVAFGLFPHSAFARRVHPPNSDIVAKLQAIRDDIRALRRNSEFQLGWAEVQHDWDEIQTDWAEAIVAIGQHLKEKMD
jgi:hypothetical protein